jgi:Flp pilus assembly protein TadG
MLDGRAFGELSRRDAGASAVELAVAAPVLLLLLFFLVQAALWMHGRNVATAAAREGVAQLRLLGDRSCGERAAAAETEVQAFAAAAGRESLLSPRVRARCDPAAGRVSIEVTARSITLVPGLRLAVDVSATGSLERFDADDS